MIDHFKGKTAVLTGAGSGFGLECARIGAQHGMNLVLVDVQQDALDKAAAEMQAAGAQVLARKVDVSSAEQMQALAAAVKERFGAPHFVFNNAGVGSGGLVWENSLADWQWVLGVNVWGVIHGVHLFTPMMLEAAKADPAYRGHIVNTLVRPGQDHCAQGGRNRDGQRRQWCGGQCLRRAGQGPRLPRGRHCGWPGQV